MSSRTPFQRLDKADVANYEDELAAVREALAATPDRAWRKRTRLLGRLGALLLANPETLEQAVSLFDDARRRADERGYDRLAAVNGIRRATALQYCGRHACALAAFDDVIRLIEDRRLRRLRDFALQHKGKCLVEVGEFEAAAQCLNDALTLRRRRGDQALIQSTLRALAGLSAEEAAVRPDSQEN